MNEMMSCINEATTMPYTLEQDIQAASKAGFKGVELWTDKLKDFLLKKNKGHLKSLLDDFNLSTPSLCPFGGFIFCTEDEFNKRVKDLEYFLDVANYIGVEYIIVCAEGLGNRSFEEAKRIYVSRLRKLSSITSEYDVRIALEWFHELQPAIEIIKAVDDENVGLVIDTFHWYRGDGRLDSLIEVPSDKLFFVHINDCEGLPREKLTDKNRLFCGRGVIPLTDILRIFKEKGYGGYLSVEIFREEYWRMDIEELAKEAYRTLIEVAFKSSVSIS